MSKKDTTVSELCVELEVTGLTVYRYVGRDGQLCEYGRR